MFKTQGVRIFGHIKNALRTKFECKLMKFEK